MSLVFNNVTNDISTNLGGVPNLGGSATNNAYIDGDKAKVDFISVTQAVDLDAIETRVNALDAAVVLMGTFDASGGAFPGGGTAQAGESWIASVGGTIDGIEINVSDRLIAITDNASTGTYSGNWHLADYSDSVQSVAGKTGAVTLVTGDITNVTTDSILGRDTAGTGVAEVLTPTQVRSILQVELGATADQTDSEIETAYNNQVAIVAQGVAEAGTSTTVYRWTPERVAQAIAAQASGVETINVETLAATKTLTATDETVQALDPNSASRNVDLPAVDDGLRFKIINTGTASGDILVIRNASAATITTLGAGQIVEVTSDGVTWFTTQGHMKSGSSNTSVGEDSIAVALRTVAFGPQSEATVNDAGAFGYKAVANELLSIALGTESKTSRVAEITTNINADSGLNYVKGSIGLIGTTTSLTETELLCGGVAGERITIQPSSILVYTAIVTGRDETTGDCCAYAFKGAIKRDGSSNTVQLGAEEKSILGEDDTSFNADIVADDTNEALVINVTAASTNLTQWVADVQYAETRF